jgi:hypothetical protein
VLSIKPCESIRKGDGTVRGPKDDIAIFSLMEAFAAANKMNGRYPKTL